MLVDVISYVQERFKPRLMIDLATLTGAIMVALGKEYAGLFVNDEKLANDLLEASAATGEKLWRMPLDKAYDKMLEFEELPTSRTSAAAGRGRARPRPSSSTSSRTRRGRTSISPVRPWMRRKSEINPSWGAGWGVRLLDRFVADKYEKAEK